MTKYNEGIFIISQRAFFLGENHAVNQQASDLLIRQGNMEGMKWFLGLVKINRA